MNSVVFSLGYLRHTVQINTEFSEIGRPEQNCSITSVTSCLAGSSCLLNDGQRSKNGLNRFAQMCYAIFRIIDSCPVDSYSEIDTDRWKDHAPKSHP